MAKDSVRVANMNATRVQKPRDDESSPTPPQTAPASPSYGLHDHSFTLQAIMELQSSFAELRSDLKNLKSSIDSTKSKVDDLVNWKHKILGGAIAFGVICTLLGFVISKAGDYITIKTPVQVTTPAK